MRIDYSSYPFIDNYKNVRLITKSFTDCMRRCSEKIEQYAYNFDSCHVCYIYIGMFIVCDFKSENGWVKSAHIKCYKGNEKGYDFTLTVGEDWKNKLSEQEQTLLFLAASFTFFIDSAEVETIHLNKKSGINFLSCHYLNNTNRNVKIYDSRWLRTIVMGDSFGVRGHFRLQPCGEKRAKRKLIWVNDFVKNGYTRIAGKIQAQQ